MSTKRSEKALLFNASSLRDLLGTTKKGNISRTTSNSTQDADAIIRGILFEETGNSIRKLPSHFPNKKNKKKDALILSAFDNPASNSHSALDQARQQRLTKNSVHSFASTLGISRDDVSYAERQFQKVLNVLKVIENILLLCYDQIVDRDDGLMTLEDSNVLLSYGGIDIEEGNYYQLCLECVRKSSSSSPSEDNIKDEYGFVHEIELIDFDVWTRTILGYQRKKLLTDMLGERRGRIAPGFLDTAHEELSRTQFMAEFRRTDQRASAPKLADSANIADASQKFPGDTSSITLHTTDFKTVDLGDFGLGITERDEENENSFSFVSKDFNYSSFNFEAVSADLNKASRLPGNGMLQLPQPPKPGITQFVGKSRSKKSLHSLQDLPQHLKKLTDKDRKEKKYKLRLEAGFDESLGRQTPRCLKSGADDSKGSVSVSSVYGPNGPTGGNKLAMIEELRRELYLAQAGLAQLDEMVDENIVWVHNNCDISGLTAGGGDGAKVFSSRAKNKCRKIAIERLFDVLDGSLKRQLYRSLHHWHNACLYEKVSSIAGLYSKVKSIEMITKVMGDAIVRRLLVGWIPWLKQTIELRRTERLAAAVEIQRVARGMLGRHRWETKHVNNAAICIQCLARKYAAKKKVNRIMRIRRQAEAKAKKKKLAKVEPSNRFMELKRELAAIKIQKIVRGKLDRYQFIIVLANYKLSTN